MRHLRPTDGKDYKTSSQFLKERKNPERIIDNKEFDQARKCLEARRKQLKKKNKAKEEKQKATEALTDEEVNILYKNIEDFYEAITEVLALSE